MEQDPLSSHRLIIDNLPDGLAAQQLAYDLGQMTLPAGAHILAETGEANGVSHLDFFDTQGHRLNPDIYELMYDTQTNTPAPVITRESTFSVLDQSTKPAGYTPADVTRTVHTLFRGVTEAAVTSYAFADHRGVRVGFQGSRFVQLLERIQEEAIDLRGIGPRSFPVLTRLVEICHLHLE